jgi:hypothetical protein
MTTSEIAARVNARAFGNGWRARCPGHGSISGTLSIAEGREGRVLLRCFAGCTTEQILAKLGLEMRDLFPKPEDSRPQSRSPVQHTATAQEIRDALVGQEAIHRKQRRIQDGERLVADDLNAIREVVAFKLRVDLKPVKRAAADSHAGGHERDPLWPALLEQKWCEAWIETDGRATCCSIDDFASHGVLGVDLLERAERLAAKELRAIAQAHQRSLSKVA